MWKRCSNPLALLAPNRKRSAGERLLPTRAVSNMKRMPPEEKRAKPLFIYDGDCLFCKFWVDYGRRLTGSAVSYSPYQEVAGQFPEIPLERFRAAAQFVDARGNISEGAKAVLQALACVPGKQWLLRLYLRVPLLAALAEWVYRFVARHRSGLYRLTRLFWGSRKLPPES